MLREGGASSTPRPLDSITAASGILDSPPPRGMTPVTRHEQRAQFIIIAPPLSPSRNPYSRIPKRRYASCASALQSDSNFCETDTHARHDQQAAGHGEEPRDLARGVAAARRHDRDRADLALYAGSGAAGAGDDIWQRHLGRADDGVAVHGRHRAVATHHGTAVGPFRATTGAARR